MPNTKTFQDGNFLVWEVYTSSSSDGYPDGSRLVFHCLTSPAMRSRVLDMPGDEAEAGRELAEASSPELLKMLEKAVEIS